MIKTSKDHLLIGTDKAKNKRIAHLNDTLVFRHLTWQPPINSLVFILSYEELPQRITF